MAQIRKGTVRLVQGSTTVRHVWTAIFTSVSGSFTAGETVTWTGGGQGTAIRYVGGTKTLTFVRTSGVAPSIGATVTGASSLASGSITAQGDGDPPNFDVLVPTGQTVILSVSGSPAPYFLTGVPGPDSVTLSAPWVPASIDEATYGLHTAFTTRGLPIIESRDVGAALLVSYGFGVVETLPARYVHVGLAGDATLGVSGTVAWDVVEYDPEGWLQAGGALRVPGGVSLVEIISGVSLLAGGAGMSFLFSVTKNGAGFSGASHFNGNSAATEKRAASLVSGPFTVAQGDLLRIAYVAVGSPSLLASSSFFKVKVLA